MFNDRYNLPHNGRRLVTCWRAIRACYRYLNIATHHLLGTVFKLVVLAYFLFCTLILTLRYAVLPNIDHYKGDVEQIASRTLGRPVTITTIYASWQGLRPNLFLGGVAIHDKDGREALRLPGVSATLSWLSVLVGDVRLYTLEVSRPDMDIQRDKDGKLFVAGIPVQTGGEDGDSKGADWILSQREIVIREGRLRWNDYRRGAPELALDGLNFVLHNAWRQHQFALKATPPENVSAPLDLRANFSHPHFAGKISNVTQWRGEVYADLQNTDLAIWKTYIDYPIEVQQGKGAVRAWLSFDRAKVADFTADLMLANVQARLRPDLPPLDLQRVSGRVSVREDYDKSVAQGTPTFGTRGHAISLTDFSLETRDGMVLPMTTISENYTPATRDRPEKTEINARLLDLRTLANFAERLPLPAAQRQMLADFSPRGQVHDFSAQWQGSYPDISAYRIRGQFIDLAMNAQAARPARPKGPKTPAQAAVPAIPGFENLTGTVDASDHGGSFSIDSRKIKFNMPGYFADPVMAFDQLDMRASWAFQEKDQLLLDVGKMEFVQGGLSGSLSGKHLMPLTPQHGKPLGTIDLTGSITGFEMKNVGRYLPLQTPEHLHHWLTGALEGGTLRDVNIRLKGDLADFPFHPAKPGDKPKGEFKVAGKIDRGRLNYAPAKFGKDGVSPFWPVLEDIKGTIVFDRTRMEIKADARTHGTTASNVTAVIPDLAVHDMLLEIDGNVSGKLQNFVQYTIDSPVYNWIGQFTEETKADGDAKLALKLQLQLAHMIDSKVQGSLQFAENDMTLQAGIPQLLRTSGKLEFNERGFNLNGIRSTFLGGQVALSGGTQRDGMTVIRADGNVSSEGLRKTYATAAMQRLAGHINGSTRYAATISVKKQRPEIIVESSMQGIALDFPAPLQKAANDSLPLRFELLALPTEDGLLRDEMHMSLGTAISARYLRQKAAEKNAEWRVLQGGIGVNVPAPQPDSGLIANVSLKSLNLDAWRRLVGTVVGGGQPSGTAPTAGDTLNIAQYIEPEVLAARATELIVMDKKLDHVVVGASHQKGVWQANIDSDQASGYLTWNESPSGRGLGKVTARLASLIIPKSAASDVTELLEGKSDAAQLPGLDIVAEDFELFGKKFGQLQLTANNVRASAAREWRISKLSIVNGQAELKATGKWSSKDGDSVSNLNFSLEMEDAGKLLDRFGYANALRGGKGRMDGDLSWKGLPFALDIPSLSGQFSLNLASGQFLKVDAGAAKLLGVLSLQSLPRRLTLDFRDLFSEGFVFDGVTGTVVIAQGVARTDNFKMRSTLATVLMDGSADVAHESANLHAVVIPEINAGGASVVYALAVNPVIGVGSFLAQLFLREPLMRAFTHEYKITGPWKEPVVTKMDRKGDVNAKDPDVPTDNREKAG